VTARKKREAPEGRAKKLFIRLSDAEERALLKAAAGFSEKARLTVGLATWARMTLLKAADGS